MITIGVMLGNINSEYVLQVMHGLCSEAKRNNFKILAFMNIQSSDYDRSELGGDMREMFHDYQAEVIYDYASMTDLDGLIISYSMVGRLMSSRTRKHFENIFQKIPTVFVSETRIFEKNSSLITDNYKAEYELTKHIIEHHNRRHLTVIAGPKENVDAAERLQAVIDCCRDHKMPLLPFQIAYGDFSPNIEVPMEKLLRDNPDMDALIAANDVMADAAMDFLTSKGIEIGKDVSVVGFDNDPDVVPFSVVPLTTAFQDAKKIGIQAVRLLIDLFDGKPGIDSKIAADIVVRESCGCNEKDKNYHHLTTGTISNQSRYRAFHERAMQVLMFVRDMTTHVNDDSKFFDIAAQNMKKIGCNGVWLALLRTPVIHRTGQEWFSPELLYIKIAVEGNEITIFDDEKCPKYNIIHDNINSISSKNHSNLYILPLYSGEYQFGLMIGDVDSAHLFYFFLASLQIVSAMEYRRIHKDMAEKTKWLEVAAQTDSMTKSLNRLGFLEVAKYSINAYKYKNMRLYFADMDHLKQINDTFGHKEGDFAIMTENALLKRTFFKPSQTLARYGGDEFVVLDTDPKTKSADEDVKTLKNLCQNFNISSNKPYYIEISCGYIDFTSDENTDISELISKADKALYEDKKSRRKSSLK